MSQFPHELAQRNPKIERITKELFENPLLVTAVLDFIEQKKSAMARAQLIALHGEEWFASKQDELTKKNTVAK